MSVINTCLLGNEYLTQLLLSLLHGTPVDLSRLFRDCALTALEPLTVRIEVADRLLRVHIASDIGWLETVLHLLDQVLAEVWLVNLHAS